MYIPVHGNADTGMAQNLAEAFHIESLLHTPGGKSVTQSVIVSVIHGSLLQNAPEMIFQGAGFHKSRCVTCQKKTGGIAVIGTYREKQGIRKGNFANG